MLLGRTPAIAFITAGLVVALSTAAGLAVQQAIDRGGEASGSGFAGFIFAAWFVNVGIYATLYKLFNHGGGMLSGDNYIRDTSCQACWNCEESPYACEFWCRPCACNAGLCHWLGQNVCIVTRDHGILSKDERMAKAKSQFLRQVLVQPQPQ